VYKKLQASFATKKRCLWKSRGKKERKREELLVFYSSIILKQTRIFSVAVVKKEHKMSDVDGTSRVRAHV
jgi:hypothetical protein